MSFLDDSLTRALRAAPELNTAPNLALGVAQNPVGDPAGTAQVVAHTANTQAQQQALDATAQKAGNPDLFHQTLGWFGHNIGKGLNNLGIGLREVQHQYRYLHDVEARHGPVAAMLEGLGIASAATAGGFFGGSQGAIAAGELAGGIQGRTIYRDSFARTTSGADYQGRYNRETGQYEGPAGKVSVGRDIASALGLRPGTKPYSFSSAGLDGLADLVFDPLVVGGKFSAAAKSAEGVSRLGNTPLTALSHAAQGDTFAVRAVDLETRVTKLPSIQRAFNELAGMNAGQIVNNYPKFEALAPELGRADTFDKVVDVFRNNLMAKEMAGSQLPSMSFTRIPFAKLSRAIQYADIPGQSVIRSATSLLPTYFDKETLALSDKGFNLGDPNAVRGVYRVMRYTQSRQVAESVATEFANAMDNPEKQITIYKNGIRSMLVAAGLPEDHRFVTSLVDEVAQRAVGGGEAVYGLDQQGRNLSKVLTAEGSSSLGLLQSQQGKLAFPDFANVTRAVRELNVAKGWYGAADDWMYNHFTQGIFKKLVLLSGGFALRISAAEAIPAMLRQGVLNTVRSRLSASVAKDITEEELTNVTHATAKALGGIDKLFGDADKTDFAVNLIHQNGGDIVSPAISTTTPSAEVGAVERQTRTLYNMHEQIPDKYKLGDTFGTFGPSDKAYTSDTWGRWLSQVSNDPASQEAAKAYMGVMRAGGTSEDATKAGADAAKQWWDSQPADIQNRMARHYAAPPGAEGVDPHAAWGQAIMENVKGVTHQPLEMGGAPHMDLLKNVADGKQTAFDKLDEIPKELWPVHLVGRQLLPDMDPLISRIANVGFRRVLDPVINFMSREPLYLNETYNQYKYLKPLVDSGDMVKEEAIALAQVRGSVGVLPFIHNTAERSQFSTLARNFMPFWFAQEQSYKRFGRLLADNPGAFRQYQLMISGLHEVGSTHTDPNGQSWLTYPGAGFLSQGTVGILGKMGIPVVGSVPVSFSGQLKSLNTVFPFAEGVRPGFGPIVSIASHLIENRFPELTPTVHSIIGDQSASGSIYDQLIPNQTLKGVIQALDPGMRSRSMQNAMMNTIQFMAYRQEKAMSEWEANGGDPNDPNAPNLIPKSTDSDEWQKFMDRVKNQTRITFIMKTAVGAVSPAAPITNVGDWNLRADLRDLIRKEGVSAGIQTFLEKNPDATPYTVFLSKSSAGGDASIPSTMTGQQWINQNLDTLHKYPNAGAWFIPQVGGDFNQGVYNEQMAQHLRFHKTPEQVMNDIYVASGNDQFYNRDLPAYRSALADAEASGSKQQAAYIRSDFSNYVKTVLGPQNPVWWDDLNSADRDHNRQLAVQQMQTMFSTGDVPDSPQASGIKSLLEDFNTYTATKQRAAVNPHITAAAVKDDWQGYLTKLAADEPTLAPVIRSIFMQL